MTIYHVLSDWGDFLCASGVAVAVAVWAWLYLSRLSAVAFSVAYLLTVACGLLLKLISQQYALPVSLANIWAFSDGAPSGHMALATVVYGSAALFFHHSASGWRALAGQAICAAVIMVVGVTRVTLQFHTIPDVLAGLALGGVAILIPASVLYRRGVEGQPLAGRLIMAMLAVGCLILMSGIRMPSTNFL